MIDAPVAFVLIGSAIQAVGPMHRVASRAVAGLAREDRVASVDAELTRDPLIAGVAGIAEIYRRG